MEEEVEEEEGEGEGEEGGEEEGWSGWGRHPSPTGRDNNIGKAMLRCTFT